MITRFFNKALPDVGIDYGQNLSFADTEIIASWALNSVKFAFAKGIMRGTSETEISPLSNTTREQAVILLKRSYEMALLDKASASLDNDPDITNPTPIPVDNGEDMDDPEGAPDSSVFDEEGDTPDDEPILLHPIYAGPHFAVNIRPPVSVEKDSGAGKVVFDNDMRGTAGMIYKDSSVDIVSPWQFAVEPSVSNPNGSDFGENALMPIYTLAENAGLVPAGNTKLRDEYARYAEGQKDIQLVPEPTVPVYGITDMTLYYTIGATGVAQSPLLFKDNDGVEWHKIGLVSARHTSSNFSEGVYVLYVRYGHTTTPIVDIYIRNHTQKDPQYEIFDQRYGGPDRHFFYIQPIVAINNPASDPPPSMTNMPQNVNRNGRAHDIGIYVVRSRFPLEGYPAIQQVRVKLWWGGSESRYHYYSPYDSVDPGTGFYPVVDANNSQQDLIEGAWSNTVNRRFLEYSFEPK